MFSPNISQRSMSEYVVSLSNYRTNNLELRGRKKTRLTINVSTVMRESIRMKKEKTPAKLVRPGICLLPELKSAPNAKRYTMSLELVL